MSKRKNTARAATKAATQAVRTAVARAVPTVAIPSISAAPEAPVALFSIAAPADASAYQDYLDQAEVCREQACLAASLKRFKAARGLFSTAVALCQQAIKLSGGKRSEARDRLRQMKQEMSAYTELAKSMERPLVRRSAAPAAAPDQSHFSPRILPPTMPKR